jgi:predicted O-methyltransferase YrrM/uncharacterized coiled-coil protein SlyX
MQLWTIMIVRNEADILAVNLLHYLELGVDRILVVDNGSTDGTDRILARLGRDRRVRWTVDNGPYLQAEITTELVREAFLGGADWVLPVDADEFWWARGDDFRAVIETSSAGAHAVEVVNFVQRRDQERLSPSSLLHMTMRPPRSVGNVEKSPELVEAREIGFVEMTYPSKWISRATIGLTVEAGNHVVTGLAGPREPTARIVCLHAPLRSRAVLDAKVEQGCRIEELGKDIRQRAWHVRRWKRLAEEGALEAEWAANSYADGALDVYGASHPLTFDPRLRDIAARWVDHANALEETSSTVFTSRVRVDSDAALEASTASAALRAYLPSDLPMLSLIVERIRSIDGWLRDDEAGLLMATAWRICIDGDTPVMLEIGSYCGKSTVALGSVVKAVRPNGRVYAIDPHEGEVGARDNKVGIQVGEPTLDALRRNLEAADVADVVEIVQQRSYDVAWTRPVDFVFIDGLHDNESVQRDFAHFDPWVTAHGYLVFHDCDDSFPGVKACVEDVLASGRYREVARASSLVVLQRLAENERIPTGALAVRSSRLERGVEFLRRLIDERDQRIAEQQRGIEWLRSVVALGESTAAELEKGIAWRREVTGSHEATVAEQEKGIAWLREVIGVREATVAEQEKGIAWLTKRITELEKGSSALPAETGTVVDQPVEDDRRQEALDGCPG